MSEYTNYDIGGLNVAGVKWSKINLDMECKIDIESGIGIELTSVESFDKKNNKIYTGLQSEFFGTDFSSEVAFHERYSCKCGAYIGKNYRDTVCTKCGTVVEYNDIDLTKFGWCILKEHQVISPIFAAKLTEALGKVNGESVLKLILSRRYHEEGIIDYTEKELDTLKHHPYILRGMTWFIENYTMVLDYYSKRKPNKRELFQELYNERANTFTHCIPIYTSLLRTELPGEKGGKNFKLRINTAARPIIRAVNDINSQIGDDQYNTLNYIDIQLKSIQNEIATIFDITYKDLTNKSGIIASKIIGGRYNFSTRCIIIPDSGNLRSDETIIGYISFMELYRYEIQNLYQKIHNVTPTEANTAWNRALNQFDQDFYDIMDGICKDPNNRKNMGILINRNPSINYGSFIYVYIVGIKKVLSDKTVVVSTHDIVPFNADFDGDQLNLFRIIGDDLHKLFAKNLNPRYNLFVSRMNGKANPEVLPVKDEIVAFWAFNNS